jgi:hypothetical protein
MNTLAPLPLGLLGLLGLLGWPAQSDPLEIVLAEYDPCGPQTLLDLDQRRPLRLRLASLKPDERIDGDLGLVRQLAPRPADPYPCCSDLSATDHGATIAKRRPTDNTSGIFCHYKGFFYPKTVNGTAAAAYIKTAYPQTAYSTNAYLPKHIVRQR